MYTYIYRLLQSFYQNTENKYSLLCFLANILWITICHIYGNTDPVIHIASLQSEGH